MGDQIIQNIIDWIEVVPPIGIYLIFFGIAYIENVIPPMPGDVIVAFGGCLAAEGVVSFTVLLVITVTASVIGFMNMYWFGYKWGAQIEESRERNFVLKFLGYKYFKRGKRWMAKWGQWVVFGNRFLAGTRSIISLTAGISKLSISSTMVNSFLSSLLWNTLLLASGWYIRDNWEVIGGYLSNYGKIILIIIALLFLIRIVVLKAKKNKAKEGE